MTELPEVLSPAPRLAWRKFFQNTPSAPASLAPEWFDGLAARSGYRDASRLYTFSSGRRLILPLAARRRTGILLSEHSWPEGWGYGGVLVEGGGEPTTTELGALTDDLSRRPAVRTSVTPDPLAATVWSRSYPPGAVVTARRSQLIDLSGGADAATQAFHSGVRRELRKALRQGLETVRDTSGGLLDEFERLYRQALLRWGAARHHPRWLVNALERHRNRPGMLRAIHRTCPDALTLWGAVRAGETLAVYAILSHQERAWEWLGAVDLNLARQTGATALLVSAIIEHEHGAGRRWLDLGESDRGSGVEERKRRFGATAYDFSTLHLDRLPVTRAQTSLRGLAASALTRRSSRDLASTSDAPAH